MIKYALFVLTIVLVLCGCSNIPQAAGEKDSVDVVTMYYAPVEGMTGAELKHGLHSLIRDHTAYPYFSDEIGVGEMMMDLDEDPENPENMILFYTGRSQNKKFADHGNKVDYMAEYGITIEDTWNREHIWAKSHGFPEMSDTAYTDIHHLRPVDRSTNGAKGAKDFDWGGYPEEEAKGSFTDFDSWEPRDEIKGDVARMIFYMAVRYEGGNDSPDLEIVDETGTSGPYYGRLSSLLEWNTLDPVDDRERTRNNGIFETYQHNRNPFVDHPEYAEMIWGEPSKEPRIMPAMPEIRFGDVATDSSYSEVLYVISGRNLEMPVTVVAPKGFMMAHMQDKPFADRMIMYPNGGALNRGLYLRFMPEENRIYADSLDIFYGDNLLSTLPLYGRGIQPGEVTILEESFEDNEHDWKRISVASNKNWYHSEYGGRNFIKISGFRGDEPSDDWLISPPLNLEPYSKITLQFETAKSHTDIMEGLEVMISGEYIPGEKLESTEWYHLPAKFSEGEYEWEHSGYLDISRFRGKNVFIAFRYRCSAKDKATSWELDDIKVTGVPFK